MVYLCLAAINFHIICRLCEIVDLSIVRFLHSRLDIRWISGLGTNVFLGLTLNHLFVSVKTSTCACMLCETRMSVIYEFKSVRACRFMLK